MMCHARPDLLHHKKCMRFMTRRCAVATTGQGLCKKFFDFLNKECGKGEDSACDTADKLGVLDASSKKKAEKPKEEKKPKKEEKKEKKRRRKATIATVVTK